MHACGLGNPKRKSSYAGKKISYLCRFVQSIGHEFREDLFTLLRRLQKASGWKRNPRATNRNLCPSTFNNHVTMHRQAG